MPPPKPLVPPWTTLLETAQLVSVRVPALKMPPPWLVLPPVILPLAMVKPLMAIAPALIVKTRLAKFASIFNAFAPGPLIVRSCPIANSPELSVIVCGLPSKKLTAPLAVVFEKLMVSPEAAAAIASRRRQLAPVPGQLLAVAGPSPAFVTVMVLAAWPLGRKKTETRKIAKSRAQIARSREGIGSSPLAEEPAASASKASAV